MSDEDGVLFVGTKKSDYVVTSYSSGEDGSPKEKVWTLLFKGVVLAQIVEDQDGDNVQ